MPYDPMGDLSFMPLVPSDQGTSSPTGIPAATDPNSLDALLASLEMQQPHPIPRPHPFRTALGNIGDALLAAAHVKAGGQPPAIGPFAANQQAQQQALEQENRQIEAANRENRNRIRIGEFTRKEKAKEAAQIKADEAAKSQAEFDRRFAMSHGGPDPTLVRQQHMQVAEWMGKYPQAGIALDDPFETALQKAQPYVSQDHALMVEAQRAALSGSLQRNTTGEQTASFTGQLPERAAAMLPEIEGAKQAAIAANLPDVAGDLDAQFQQLNDAAQAAQADPSPTSQQFYNTALANLRKALKDTKSNAGKLSRVDARDRENITTLRTLGTFVDQVDAMLQQYGDIGGPVAGSEAGRLFTRAYSAATGSQNAKLQSDFSALASDISSTLANLKGGKAITATEMKLFKDTLIRLAQFGTDKKAAINQLKSRIGIMQTTYRSFYNLDQSLYGALESGPQANPRDAGDVPDDLVNPFGGQ